MLDIMRPRSLSVAERNPRLRPNSRQSCRSEGKSMFFGSIPALVTPFAAGRVDHALFRDFVEWQIDEGIDRAGAVRDDRRSGDADHRRASRADRADGRGGARAGAGDRRLRVERHGACDRADPQCQGGRAPMRRCTSRLITTGPTRTGSTLHLAAVADARHPGRALQRAGADDHRHFGRDDGAGWRGCPM